MLPFFPTPMLLSAANIPVGQQLFLTNTSWTVPAGVTEISCVAIGKGGNSLVNSSQALKRGGGGGELRYINAIPVFPGEVLTIDISTAWSQIVRGSTVILRAVAGVNGGSGGSGGIGGVGWPGSSGGTANQFDSPAIAEGGGAGNYTKTNARGDGGSSPYGDGNRPTTSIYGAGASRQYSNTAGQPGCVRVIHGDGRAFPNTLTEDM